MISRQLATRLLIKVGGLTVHGRTLSGLTARNLRGVDGLLWKQGVDLKSCQWMGFQTTASNQFFWSKKKDKNATKAAVLPKLPNSDGEVMPTKMSIEVDDNMAHPIWPREQLELVKIKHTKPEKMVDRLAYLSVQTLRRGFDITSGYAFGKISEAKWIRRIVFLETVAGVPGMMGAMVRHLNSLRKMKRDGGWIHTLLEEAENERMHLMVALELQQPGFFFRLGTLVTQGVFTNLFFLAYLISPRYCHRFVGYLEEEAVKTYTKLIEDIDKGHMAKWRVEHAPVIAIRYWRLPEDATKRDMVLAIRADEALHRLVNHTLASIRSDERNPFAPLESGILH